MLEAPVLSVVDESGSETDTLIRLQKTAVRLGKKEE
jgi:hypothetical protein